MGLLTSWFAPMLYVQIAPERLSVHNPKSGASFSEPPEVAIARAPKAGIVGFGAAARLRAAEPSVEIVNPFGHPRSLVSDFTVAEQLLKAVIRRVEGASLLSLAPRVVMHPLGDPAGGFTQVEIRAFHEMALGAGASEARVWQGRPLTDEELLSRQFPLDGTLLS
ncbi:rod shape-determining protein [Pseudorhodoferax sp. LjRoot39]|uniref:rod shape-determining protein n=1 Tax=Pseudorhodoferax sp. LjRoot39 TaxID=3342328 RepID=UPI003ECE4578